MSLDDEDIARLREFAGKATLTPYHVDDRFVVEDSMDVTVAVGRGYRYIENAQFIAAACNLAIPMADEIEKVKKGRDDARKLAGQWFDHHNAAIVENSALKLELDDAISKLTCVQQLSSEELVGEQNATICRLENENKKLAEEYDFLASVSSGNALSAADYHAQLVEKEKAFQELEARYKDLLGRWGQ